MAAIHSNRGSKLIMNAQAKSFIVILGLLVIALVLKPSDGATTQPRLNPKVPNHRQVLVQQGEKQNNAEDNSNPPEVDHRPKALGLRRQDPPKRHTEEPETHETENTVVEEEQPRKLEKDKKIPHTKEDKKRKHEDKEEEEELEEDQANKKSRKKIKKVLSNADEKGKGFKLSSHPDCAQDSKDLCRHVDQKNNFAILACLQDNAVADDSHLSDGCHQLLWHYKVNLTSDPRFDQAAMDICKKSIDKLENCKKEFKPDGSLVNCLVEHRELVEDNKCRNFLQKMSVIVFSDYRLIKGFYDRCISDVRKFKCAILSDEKDKEEIHAQGEVIECLEENVENLSQECKKEINRVAELSSDDYHMDRALYYACQDARERFCSKVQSGQGRIYKCLMKHKDEETMSSECQKKLTVREKLMVQNVKVNHPLWEHCHEHYEAYGCKDGKSESGKAAHLLLCLNKAIAEGKTVNAQCLAEMQDFGTQLFQDFKLNPEIVAFCENEIETHCKQEFRPDGAALDCLMGLAKNNKLSPKCYKSVNAVLKQSGAGTHYKIDRPLLIACDAVIQSLCKDKKEAMVLGCLMDNIYSDVMTPACQKEIFHLQYFLARDFSLDQDLYKDCKDDAEKLCSAPSFSDADLSMPPGIIISCLYRASAESVEKAHRASKQCAAHVRRVMHQRASSVKLMPEIEGPCMADLGNVCLESTKEHEEIACLQQHYDKLTPGCKSAISNFTEMESEDMEMDKDLVHACSPMVAKFCQEVLDRGDSENVLACLIGNKNHAGMDPKCQVAIEHWQLIEMKDFKFSHKLKKACYNDVMKHCQSAESKFDAVKCLSTIIKEDTMKNADHRISKTCASQIREELKVQSEDIQLNPDFLKSCESDLKRFCQDVPFQQAKAEECLRKHERDLSPSCKTLLYREELKESKDNELDYQLMHVCKPMIKLFCSDEPQKEILRCLRKFKNDIQMDPPCRAVIFERQVEESKRFELDPDLSEFCEKDVQEHCKAVLDSGRGEIIKCLKDQIRKEVLMPECEDFVRTREEEAALDYRLDPALETACKIEIVDLCKTVEPGRGRVANCLKKNIKKITNNECKTEVKRLLEEGEEDVHADPPLMDACREDIAQYCAKRRRGHGAVVNCLMDVYNSKTLELEGACHSFLSERITLWNYAGTGKQLKSFSDLLMKVHESSERNYFYIVAGCIITALFIFGLCFGRVTKRVPQAYKNR